MLARNTPRLLRGTKQSKSTLSPSTGGTHSSIRSSNNTAQRRISFASIFRNPIGRTGSIIDSSSLPTPTSPGKIINTSPDSSTTYLINAFTQGHLLDTPHNQNKAVPQYQSAARGRHTRVYGSGSPLDAASAEYGVRQEKPGRMGRGNREQVGFVEQVGSGSGSALWFEREEERREEEEGRKV
ncbi:hypothetical protein MD484_g3068, partial [Candolleomyces efflorescens]